MPNNALRTYCTVLRWTSRTTSITTAKATLSAIARPISFVAM